jgi:methylated-DNA-[protein]-cysteine S-methyltransferase
VFLLILYISTLKWEEYIFYIARTNNGIAFVSIDEKELYDWKQKYLPHAFIHQDFSDKYYHQIYRYLNGSETLLNLPVDLYGTKFQKIVWTTLQSIPYGHVTTYTAIAEKINKPTAVRAVANAIGKNPILLIVPCHRVIRKNGELSGFRAGVSLKKKLLQLEQAI